MPYLAYELDALAKAQNAARAARVAADCIHGGNLRMWEHCWRSGTAVLTAIQIRGFYETSEDVIPALVAFGFLEPEGDGFRVKGAERYLRVKEARKKGGQAAKGNLIPGARQKKAAQSPAEKQPRSSREPAEKPSGLPLGSLSALTASSEQQLKKDLLPPPEANPPVPQKLESAETERASSDAPRPGWKELIADLEAAYRERLGGKWAFVAGRDTTALKALRQSFSDEEIRTQWRKGLSLTGYAQPTNLAELRSKWGAIAAATVTPKPGKPEPRLEAPCRPLV